MKGKLVKRSNGRFDLYKIEDVDQLNTIASSFDNPKEKLSLKNCQAIENGYDLDELGSYWRWYYSDIVPEHLRDHLKNSYKAGFQKALEILGDKKFSEKDMIMFGLFCRNNHISECLSVTDELFPKYQSLQQTEWDVEIEMRPASLVYKSDEMLPKLDTDGCLILKRL